MNVLLDLDGTLTDPQVGIVACIQHALRTLGQEVPDHAALIQYIGPPLRASFVELIPGCDDAFADKAVAAYRERFTAAGMFENSVYAGIPEALQQLRDRGERLYLATSKPRVFAEKILDHFHLGHHFEAIYGSELDGRLTDKVDLIAHIVASSNLERTETTMVGDRRHDAIGAIANGVQPVGVLWGYGSKAELLAAGAERLLESPSQLGMLPRIR